MRHGIVLTFVFASALYLQGQANPSPQPAAPSILQDYDQAIDAVAEKAMQSVVEIEVTGYGVPEHNDDNSTPQMLQRQRSLGSGVIVDPDGYIVTNNHVVNGAVRIRVIISPATVEMAPYHTSLARKQRVYEAKLIGTNHYADLAVIKIEEKNLPAMPLPNEQFHVRLGQSVLAIGAPQGLDHTVTKGIVSAIGRQPELDRPMVYVQTDAPINPGNSGGPLVDRNGNLIGINTFILSSGGGSEGLGFAIPEPVVRFAYNEIKAHGGVHPITIGAHAQTITPDLASGLKLPQDWGVIISDTDPGSPAETAGLHRGDVITAIDGIPIDSLPKYTAYMYLHPRGFPMQMKILRSGQPVTVTVMPIDAPPTVDSLSDLINPSTDLIASLGVFCIDLKGPLSDSMQTRSKTGILVAGLLSGEPATLADLEQGDLILTMNGKPVSDTAHLRQDLVNFKPGNAVVFEVERQGVIQYVAFEIE
ncbi:trypsin-like peptidase domain-containing protein [Alloacidobacterium dinghuense]|uniref:Trypsin-like peptidase domain-containing protein n=1 Tax=Alloacidobacterium dinghuense TaxID=2763107 RepID=A0A7G8BCB2_9BACT|nr:trypsin-like peptidase domain-containing protein [Alloacidobacterium dinghuense]QNI30182.1 trypsin-like peptidase domain-containing protein [Alloacidobacterium dinghuense]